MKKRIGVILTFLLLVFIGVFVIGEVVNSEVGGVEKHAIASFEGEPEFFWDVIIDEGSPEENLEITAEIIDSTSSEICVGFKDKAKYAASLIALEKDIKKVPISKEQLGDKFTVDETELDLSSKEKGDEVCFYVDYDEPEIGMGVKIGWNTAHVVLDNANKQGIGNGQGRILRNTAGETVLFFKAGNYKAAYTTAKPPTQTSDWTIINLTGPGGVISTSTDYSYGYTIDIDYVSDTLHFLFSSRRGDINRVAYSKCDISSGNGGVAAIATSACWECNNGTTDCYEDLPSSMYRVLDAYGGMAVNETGTPYVMGDVYDITFHYYNGTDWTNELIIDTHNKYGDIAIDDNNVVWIAYINETPSEWTVVVTNCSSSCENLGSWSTPLIVLEDDEAGEDLNEFPNIIIDGNGRPHVSAADNSVVYPKQEVLFNFINETDDWRYGTGADSGTNITGGNYGGMENSLAATAGGYVFGLFGWTGTSQSNSKDEYTTINSASYLGTPPAYYRSGCERKQLWTDSSIHCVGDDNHDIEFFYLTTETGSPWWSEGIVILGEGDINDCVEIDSSGTYQLVSDITNSANDTCCINITANDVLFDGQGYKVAGKNTQGTGICVVRSSSTDTNVTIEDTHVTYWEKGIYLKNANENNITDNTVKKFSPNVPMAIHVEDSYENIIRKNVIGESDYGIYLDNSDNNTIANNSINGHDVFGIKIDKAADNVIANNSIYDNYEYGLYFDGVYDKRNVIYNNFLNNTNNSFWRSAPTSKNDFNLGSALDEVNIIGGSEIGGNYWAKPDGTGYSENCQNNDGDSFCDLTYDVEDDESCEGGTCSSNHDGLPLTAHGASTTTTEVSYLYGVRGLLAKVVSGQKSVYAKDSSGNPRAIVRVNASGERVIWSQDFHATGEPVNEETDETMSAGSKMNDVVSGNLLGSVIYAPAQLLKLGSAAGMAIDGCGDCVGTDCVCPACPVKELSCEDKYTVSSCNSGEGGCTKPCQSAQGEGGSPDNWCIGGGWFNKGDEYEAMISCMNAKYKLSEPMPGCDERWYSRVWDPDDTTHNCCVCPHDDGWQVGSGILCEEVDCS